MCALIRKHPIPSFFVIAFALSWIGSASYLLAQPARGLVLPPVLGVPAAVFWYYGPCLAAIIITRITGGKGSVRRFLKRLLDWRVSWKWYASIVLYPLAMHLVVVYLGQVLGGPPPVFFQGDGVPQGDVWLVLIGLVIFHFLVRGIGEETGWRGFALPGLQSRWNGLTASLVLGLLWGLWHFHPANYALFSVGGIFIFVNIFLVTPICTWVYNHTKGSIFIAAMFHMTLNVAEFVVPIGMTEAGLTRNLLQLAVLLVTLIVLVRISGPQLGKNKMETIGT